MQHPTPVRTEAPSRTPLTAQQLYHTSAPHADTRNGGITQWLQQTNSLGHGPPPSQKQAAPYWHHSNTSSVPPSDALVDRNPTAPWVGLPLMYTASNDSDNYGHSSHGSNHRFMLEPSHPQFHRVHHSSHHALSHHHHHQHHHHPSIQQQQQQHRYLMEHEQQQKSLVQQSNASLHSAVDLAQCPPPYIYHEKKQAMTTGTNPVVKTGKNSVPTANSQKALSVPRRKTERACVHCKRAHASCDHERPCRRCVTRGLAHTCVDSMRKRARYLQDVPSAQLTESLGSLGALPSRNVTSVTSTQNPLVHVHGAGQRVVDIVSQVPDVNTQKRRHDQSHYPVLSNHAAAAAAAANVAQPSSYFPSMEHTPSYDSSSTFQLPSHYAHGHGRQSPMIADMLLDLNQGRSGSSSGDSQSMKQSNTMPAMTMEELANQITHRLDDGGRAARGATAAAGIGNSSTTYSGVNQDSRSSNSSNSSSDQQTIGANSQKGHHSALPRITPFSFGSGLVVREYAKLGELCKSQQQASSLKRQEQQEYSYEHDSGVQGSGNGSVHSGASADGDSDQSARGTDSSGCGTGVEPETNNTERKAKADIFITSSPHHQSNNVPPHRIPSNKEIYSSVSRPYEYSRSFQYLILYVRDRMPHEKFVRICRSLAYFRPSFMASMQHMSPEDLIFMEICFQRMSRQVEKLFAFMGTPTCIWRRTGELVSCSKEFSVMTQWPRDDLLQAGGKFVYELLDDDSVVLYWENFSRIALNNSAQSMTMPCKVLTADQKWLSCALCFTIKRCIFDVPLVIVGQFLPVL